MNAPFHRSLLETPDYPTLSRVMRIAPPPGEKPVEGYSWGDYEDVSGDAEKEESEGEWGVVKSKKSSTCLPPIPSSYLPFVARQVANRSSFRPIDYRHLDAIVIIHQPIRDIELGCWRQTEQDAEEEPEAEG
jgi:hypothetical protein